MTEHAPSSEDVPDGTFPGQALCWSVSGEAHLCSLPASHKGPHRSRFHDTEWPRTTEPQATSTNPGGAS